MPSPEIFLHQHNPHLHHSEAVEQTAAYLNSNGERIPNQPEDKIAAYLGFLASEVNDGILTGDDDSIERQIEFHVAEKDETLRADQQESLNLWTEHLNNDEENYPDWFKHYAWNSLVKLGVFNKEKNEFNKRSRGTAVPYPELNPEALSYVYHVLNEGRVQGEPLDEGGCDEKLEKLTQSANFSKLYGHFLAKVTLLSPERRQETKGSWNAFEQSSDPATAREVAGWLKGLGTGWCMDRRFRAASYLKDGDFHVYCSCDEAGKDSVPRVAIRLYNGKVVELRGIATQQNLEDVMTDVAENKLETLPGGEAHMQKAANMRQLSKLDKILADNPNGELSSDDLRFLHELDEPVEGFGIKPDPRIVELQEGRDLRQDLAQVLQLRPDQISFTKQEALAGGVAYHHDSLSCYGLESAEDLKLPDRIGGSLWLNSLIDIEHLALPNVVEGSVWLEGITNADNLKLPSEITSNILIDSATSAENIQLPDEIGGKVYAKSLPVEAKEVLRARYPRLKII